MCNITTGGYEKLVLDIVVSYRKVNQQRSEVTNKDKPVWKKTAPPDQVKLEPSRD
jgi:hypothetical protein